MKLFTRENDESCTTIWTPFLNGNTLKLTQRKLLCAWSRFNLIYQDCDRVERARKCATLHISRTVTSNVLKLGKDEDRTFMNRSLVLQTIVCC